MTFSISWAMTLRCDKVGVVEDLAEDALGEEVLDEHLLHGLARRGWG